MRPAAAPHYVGPPSPFGGGTTLSLNRLSDLLFFVGVILVAVGCWMIYPPFAFLAGGAGLLFAAYRLDLPGRAR